AEAEQVGAEPAQLLGGMADLQAELLLVHGADGRQIHAGDELLMQFLLILKKTLLPRPRDRAAVVLTTAKMDPTHTPIRLSSVARQPMPTPAASGRPRVGP